MTYDLKEELQLPSRAAAIFLIAALVQGCAVWGGWQPLDAESNKLHKGWSVWIRADQSPYSGCGVYVWMLMREESFPPSVRIAPEAVRLFDPQGKPLVGGPLSTSTGYPHWVDSVNVYEIFGDRHAAACLDSVSLPHDLTCRIILNVLELDSRSVRADSVDIHMTYRKGIYFTGGV